MKIYEYFALGKTVVATRLPELVKYESICYLADSTYDFVSKVELAVQDLHNNNELSIKQNKTKRRSIANQNTWKKRVEFIHSVIENASVGISNDV